MPREAGGVRRRPDLEKRRMKAEAPVAKSSELDSCTSLGTVLPAGGSIVAIRREKD